MCIRLRLGQQLLVTDFCNITGSVTSLWPLMPVWWSVSLWWFPKRARSYTSMLLSGHLFNIHLHCFVVLLLRRLLDPHVNIEPRDMPGPQLETGLRWSLVILISSTSSKHTWDSAREPSGPSVRQACIFNTSFMERSKYLKINISFPSVIFKVENHPWYSS